MSESHAPVAAPRPVPFIARCKGEVPYTGPLTMTDGWISYPATRTSDRGEGSVLIQRTVGAPTGPVRAADIDPGRQFEAMAGFLCQGCGGPSTRRPGSHARLWALPAVQNGRPVEPAGLRTESPPVCAVCVREHLPRCPVMRPGHQLLWVRLAPVVGVMATPLPPSLPSVGTAPPRFLPLPPDIDSDDGGMEGGAPLGGACAAWQCALAQSLVREIQSCIPADPAKVAELAARQRVEQAGGGPCPLSAPVGSALSTAGGTR
ncbi:hypothetical protein PUR49_32310 [Streptomyces sp. BE147]|uniref:hypothetical protein n=1 Tax=Streptomyces sp. BE147 TaxID=3002524 RepID=UPI002E77409F|nr:hypothetical protein [Streptomyces sp. BE147]MEE1741157.1 hypothetical protein [Streptomyces sp. BE147]